MKKLKDMGLKLETCCGFSLYNVGLIIGNLELIVNLIRFLNVFVDPTISVFVFRFFELCVSACWIYGVYSVSNI